MNINEISAEIEIKETHINKKIRIMNSLEEINRKFDLEKIL